MSKCRECDTDLPIDTFNGMHFCPNAECNRHGLYVTRQEIEVDDERRVRIAAREANDAR